MTKRLLYGLITGLITFALGLVLALNRNTSRPMSLCELDAKPEAYAGQTIRFRATLTRTSKHILAASICRNGETSRAGIELNPAEGVNIILPESHFSQDDNGSNIHLIDAEVVGQLDSTFGPGCYGPKYQVMNARVKRVFSVNQFDNGQEAFEWLKSNSY